jgi:hypothetical protein
MRIQYFSISIALLTCAVNTNAQEKPAPCNEADIRPPATSADVQIAKRAGEILDSASKWNRADTRDCPTGATTFSLYCALEKATDEVSGNFEHRGAAMQEARFVIEDVSPKTKDYDHRLMDYNNDPTTSFIDIQKVFRLLEERIASRVREDSTKPHPTAAQSAVGCGAAVLSGAEIRIVKRVREILDSPAKWNRASTQECPADAVTFGLYCAFAKASTEVNGSFDGSGVAIDEARSLIDRKYPARLVGYNNDPAVSLADIQNLLQRVENRLAGK